jgi:glycosyltransferase involved in cell wall biosynthesis
VSAEAKRGLAWRLVVRPIAMLVDGLIAVAFVVPAFPLAWLSRLARRPIDVGLGPEPLINNLYHKKALATFGYSAETFVDHVYYITSDFDYRADLRIRRPFGPLRPLILFVRAIFRYRALYIYFNGGPLMSRPLLWRLEPLLYRAAGIRVVVMPYGADVQEMTRSRNLAFKHAIARDYPESRLRRSRVAAQIDLWTRYADSVISGVEWVDYMYHWDELMLGHFSIEPRPSSEFAPFATSGPLRILHAPNHRAIKGSDHFQRAVDELRAEGVDVEMVTLEQVPNETILQAMADCDVVADQLIVGWYAMFALEAMSMGKPVLCYLRQDLIDLYTSEGLVRPGEIPIVNCSPLTVKEAIRRLANNRAELPEIGRLGQAYVQEHHSLEVIGEVFDRINRSMGVDPTGVTD